MRLPEEVRDFALALCRFLSVGIKSETWGSTLPGRVGAADEAPPAVDDPRDGEVWLLLLSEDAPEPNVTIAHEVAHAWLGHDQLEGQPGTSSLAHAEEVAASTLAQSWGFTGAPADPNIYPGKNPAGVTQTVTRGEDRGGENGL